MWGLFPWPGIKPGPFVLGDWSLSYWSTRGVPATWVWEETRTRAGGAAVKASPTLGPHDPAGPMTLAVSVTNRSAVQSFWKAPRGLQRRPQDVRANSPPPLPIEPFSLWEIFSGFGLERPNHGTSGEDAAWVAHHELGIVVLILPFGAGSSRAAVALADVRPSLGVSKGAHRLHQRLARTPLLPTPAFASCHQSRPVTSWGAFLASWWKEKELEPGFQMVCMRSFWHSEVDSSSGQPYCRSEISLAKLRGQQGWVPSRHSRGHPFPCLVQLLEPISIIWLRTSLSIFQANCITSVNLFFPDSDPPELGSEVKRNPLDSTSGCALCLEWEMPGRMSVPWFMGSGWLFGWIVKVLRGSKLEN